HRHEFWYCSVCRRGKCEQEPEPAEWRIAVRRGRGTALLHADWTDTVGRCRPDPASLGQGSPQSRRPLPDLHRTGTGFLMRRGLKITAWSLAAVAALIVLLFGALLITGNTESGRAFIVRVTARLTNGHVQLAGIHGSFPAALDLDRLQLSDDD